MAGSGLIIDGGGKPRRKASQVKGARAQGKALNRLKKVTKEIDQRFKVSDKLFQEKQKLKEQLGID